MTNGLSYIRSKNKMTNIEFFLNAVKNAVMVFTDFQHVVRNVPIHHTEQVVNLTVTVNRNRVTIWRDVLYQYLKRVNDITIDFTVTCKKKSILLSLFVEYVNNITIYVLLFNSCLISEELNVKGKKNLTEEHIITPSNKTFMIWNDVTATGNLAQSSAHSLFEQMMLTGVSNSLPVIITLVVVGCLHCMGRILLPVF